MNQSCTYILKVEILSALKMDESSKQFGYFSSYDSKHFSIKTITFSFYIEIQKLIYNVLVSTHVSFTENYIYSLNYSIEQFSIHNRLQVSDEYFLSSHLILSHPSMYNFRFNSLYTIIYKETKNKNHQQVVARVLLLK